MSRRSTDETPIICELSNPEFLSQLQSALRNIGVMVELEH